MSSRKLQLHPEAAAEVREVRNWYRAQRPSLERELVECLGATIDALKEGHAALSPTRYVPEELSVKRVHLSRFPYSLFVLPNEQPLLIVAFAHDHRRPGYWLPRLVK